MRVEWVNIHRAIQVILKCLIWQYGGFMQVMNNFYSTFDTLWLHLAKTPSYINKSFYRLVCPVGIPKGKFVESQGRCHGYIGFGALIEFCYQQASHVCILETCHYEIVPLKKSSKRIPLDKVVIQLILNMGKLHFYVIKYFRHSKNKYISKDAAKMNPQYSLIHVYEEKTSTNKNSIHLKIFRLLFWCFNSMMLNMHVL